MDTLVDSLESVLDTLNNSKYEAEYSVSHTLSYIVA